MIPVLCIAGAGRSGSTILAHLLGEDARVCAVGELRNLWISAVLQRSNCACGETIDACEFWGPIVKELQLDDEVAARFVWSWQKENLGATSVGNLRLTRPGTEPSDPEAFDAYTNLLSQLYTQIAERSGADVIVDSSKGPIDAAVLARVPGIMPRFIHLVRDPRAVAFSWSRKKSADPSSDRLFTRKGTLKATAVWLAHNLESEVVRRLDKGHTWTRLRYEDFVADPHATVTALLGDTIGTTQTRSTPQQHTIGGNPVRFEKGNIEIRADDEWIEKMPRSKRRLVTLATLPLLKAYGYPVGIGPT